MTGFSANSLNWTTGILAGWTYDKPINKWFQGQFRNAHLITRDCPTCREIIALTVTTKALLGEVTNHGLSLRRCKTCRTALKRDPQAYTERKALGADRRDAPADEIPAGSVAINAVELESLHATIKCMKEELDGFYAATRRKMPWE